MASSQKVISSETVRPGEDEAGLVARARAGEASAIDQLVRRYLADVYNVTVRVLGNHDLAEDAAQEAMLNALRGLKRFRGDASFRTWLLRIAVNAARTVARRQFRRREVALELVVETPGHEPDSASMMVLRAEAARCTTLLAQLPEKQRLAVTLRIEQGLSYKEIGEILDSTEGAARVNYHLGIKRLRELATC